MMSRILIAAAISLASSLQCNVVLPTLGCYDDEKGPHALPNLVIQDLQMTLQECVNVCAYTGFSMAGVTGHVSPAPPSYACYCGSSIAPGAVVAPTASCNVPCPGGGPGPCGANYMLSVYNMSCDGPLPPPPGPPLTGQACSQPESTGWAFCNKAALSLDERVADLVSRLNLFEMGPQLTARAAPAIPRLGIPSYYWGLNTVHGITNPVTGGTLCPAGSNKCPTIWPAGAALGASFNASAWKMMGAVTGQEMRALNNLAWGGLSAPVDALVSWGPVVNLQRDPRWGRNQETPSSDPFVLSTFTVSVTRGMQEGEDSRYIMAGTTLKHFLAYSLEDYYTPAGQHVTRENFNAVVTPFDLYDTYAPHFRAGVMPVSAGGGAAIGIMMAMNELNGTPCTANPFLIGDLLFRQWGMDGYVTSDGGNMITDMIRPYPQGHGWCPYHAGNCSIDEAVEAASAARCAIADGDEYNDHTVSSVLAGNATIAAIEQLLTDTFRVRFRLGLFDNNSATTSPYWAYGLEHLASPEAQAANTLAAHQGLVLLQRGETVPGTPSLPFTRGTGGTTAVIGYAVNDTDKLVANYVQEYCPSGEKTCFPTLLNALVALGEVTAYSPGCTNAKTCSLDDINAAAAIAGSSDRVILQLGLDQYLEGEQLDRANVTLPLPQQQLFAAVAAAAQGKPFAVVLIHGGAVAIDEVKASSAGILDAFYPGTQGGPAIADALFGLYNPGGKLPHDVYGAAYGAVDFTDMSVASLGRTYRYGGTSAPGGMPLWPFGFGLSYTTFSLAWAGANPAPITVTPASGLLSFDVTVRNTGAVDGDEVVQVYIIPTAGTLQPMPPFIPNRFLVAFQRVSGLAAGTSTTVTLTMNAPVAFTMTTDAAGTRGLVAGGYTIAFGRGVNGDELSVAATVAP